MKIYRLVKNKILTLLGQRTIGARILLMNVKDYIIQALQDCNIIGLGEGAHGLENYFIVKIVWIGDRKKPQVNRYYSYDFTRNKTPHCQINLA